jgi:hypothetical protein
VVAAVSANGVRRLFPVECPVCGTPTDHDGIARCSNMVAGIRARVQEVMELHHRDEGDGHCFECVEPWPCRTVELLGPLA